MGGTICTCSRQEGQVGRSILWLPWYIVNKFLASVDAAEDALGHPPNVVEIFCQMEASFDMPVKNIYELAAVLTSLQREDVIFADSTCFRYTRQKKEGYFSYTEIFNKKFPGYALDKKQRVIADTAKTVNFEQLLTCLKSSDSKLLDELRWAFDGEFRFLDGRSIEDQKMRIAFNTYPRSGNSFLRRLLEQVTGITTGATVSLHTSTSLQVMGLKGEEICDDRVFIVKAHHPMMMPATLAFSANKVICCVRNPLDVFVSWASLCNMMNHAAKPEFDYEKEFPEWFDWWVRWCTDAHRQYFDTMIAHATKDLKAPLHICRYEDLIKQPEKELNDMFKFLLDLDSLEGTNAETRIKEVVAMGSKATQTYNLKDTTGKFNINASRYTESQIEYMKEKIGDQLYFFGYSNHPEEEHNTAFFNFDEHKPENLAQFNGFRRVNEDGLKEVLTQPRPLK